MSSRHRAGRLGMGGAAVRSMARLNSAHEVRAVAGVLLLSEVRARCRLGGVVECYCSLKIIIDGVGQPDALRLALAPCIFST